MIRSLQLIALWFLLLAGSRAVPAQVAPKVSPGDGDVVKKGANEFGVWGAISFDTPTLIGKTTDAKFGEIGLRYGRVLWTNDKMAFTWTIDVVPVAILSTPRVVTFVDSNGSVLVTRVKKSVYGWGVAPIGLKFNFRRKRQVQPFIHATGGFLHFDEDVPVSGAKRYNFSFDFASGIQIINRKGRAVSIGYKYTHFSNADRSSINPGVDSQMVFASFAVFK